MSARDRKLLEYLKTFHSKPPKKVVKQIRQAREFPTFVVGVHSQEKHYRSKLVDAGLIEALFEFLDQASHHTFEEVKKGGDVPSPYHWITALETTVCCPHHDENHEVEARLLTARRIGPLADCMVDPERELFLERQHWLASVCGYAGVLASLAFTEATIPILLEHQSVVDFVLQALFWETCRPDIVQELNLFYSNQPQDPTHGSAGDFDALKFRVAFVVRALCWRPGIQHPLTDENLVHAHRMMNTPAVCSSYDGPSTISSGEPVTLGSGLFDLLRRETDPKVEELLYSILKLQAAAHCLGKDSIADLVEVMKNVKSGPSARDMLSALMESLLRINDNGSVMPEDGKMAIAVGAGLFEVCLQLLVDFNDRVDLEEGISGLFQQAGRVALTHKTGKAIQDRAPLIRQKAEEVRALNLPTVTKLANTAQGIVNEASVVDQNAVDVFRCAWCEKKIASEEKRRCSRCKHTTYCSRECQVRDWKEGRHKRMCKAMVESCNRMEAKGASYKEMNRIYSTRENRGKVAIEMFHQNVEEFCWQAVLLGHDILDCVLEIDISTQPMGLAISGASEFLKTLEKEGNPSGGFSCMIEENRQKGALTLACKSALTTGSKKGTLIMDLIIIPADEWNEKQLQVFRERIDEWNENNMRAARSNLVDKLRKQQQDQA